MGKITKGPNTKKLLPKLHLIENAFPYIVYYYDFLSLRVSIENKTLLNLP